MTSAIDPFDIWDKYAYFKCSCCRSKPLVVVTSLDINVVWNAATQAYAFTRRCHLCCNICSNMMQIHWSSTNSSISNKWVQDREDIIWCTSNAIPSDSAIFVTQCRRPEIVPIQLRCIRYFLDAIKNTKKFLCTPVRDKFKKDCCLWMTYKAVEQLTTSTWHRTYPVLTSIWSHVC